MQESIIDYLESECSFLHKCFIDYEVDYSLSTEHCLVVDTTISKKDKDYVFKLEIPTPDESGIFHLSRYLVKILPQLRMEDQNDLSKCAVRTDLQIYLDMLKQAMTYVAYRFSNVSEFQNGDYINSRLRGFLSNDPNVRIIPDYLNQSAYKAIMNMVQVIPLTDEFNTKPINWEGIIDLHTSPTSEKIGYIFQLAHGTEVRDGKLVNESDHVLSYLNLANSIFPDYAPTQLYKTRSPFMFHLPLVKPESPKVRSVYYEGDLSGKQLTTAVMATPHNQYDQIQISESAAEELEAWFHASMVINSREPIHLEVSENQEVDHGSVIAKAMLYSSKENKYILQDIKQTKIQGKATVVSILEEETVSGGVKLYRVRFLLKTKVRMEDGDKIITRHGAKGVVRIVPNNDMPHFANGKPVDICVNPVSVAGRINIAFFAEAIYAEKCIADKNEFIEVSPDTKIDWEYFINQGFGHKQQLYRKVSGGFQEYEHETFVGNIFWLRTDSISRNRVVSSTGGVKDFSGLPSDTTRGSGMKMALDMRMLLWAKGLQRFDGLLYSLNRDKKAEARSKVYWDMVFERTPQQLLEELETPNAIEIWEEETPETENLSITEEVGDYKEATL